MTALMTRIFSRNLTVGVHNGLRPRNFAAKMFPLIPPIHHEIFKNV